MIEPPARCDEREKEFITHDESTSSSAVVACGRTGRPPTAVFFGLPVTAWIVIGVEFFERLAYYGAAFTLSTYSTNLLNLTESTSNLIVNILYVVSPLSACVASGIADGPFGRSRSLLMYLVIYTLGLAIISVSSFPWMYADFPYNPSTLSLWLFIGGIVVFGIGYGGFKVCTSPLTADELCRVLEDTFYASHDQSMDSPPLSLKREFENFKEAQLSFLFRLVYWSINFGSLFGIIGAPALRALDSRSVVSGSSTAHTGYYAGFLMCVVSTALGTMLYIVSYRRFHRNAPTESFLLFRVVYRAVQTRLRFALGWLQDDAFIHQHRSECLIFASWVPSEDTSSAFSACGGRRFDDAIVSSVRQTLTFCKTFVTLPLYWLISNQFSTNVVLTANNMDIPAGVPPEALNNVNTLSLLATVVVVDRWLFPWWFGKDTRPCVQSRITVGFMMVAVAMAWCGVLQLVIDHRGTYDAGGDYHLLPGQSYLSVMWMLGPYVLQGIASVFVDTTVLETAYMMAPSNMKSTVMALYLLASSGSGFLGIAFTPLSDQSVIGIMYFVLAFLQGLVTLLFLRSGVERAIVTPPGEMLPLLPGHDTSA